MLGTGHAAVTFAHDVQLPDDGHVVAVGSRTREGAAGTNRAAVIGTTGRLEIDGTFYAPSGFTLARPGAGAPETWQELRAGHGLRHQVQEVRRCLAAGLPESPDMPLDESVSIMSTMDEVRRQIGLRFPGPPG